MRLEGKSGRATVGVVQALGRPPSQRAAAQAPHFNPSFPGVSMADRRTVHSIPNQAQDEAQLCLLDTDKKK